jgi:hypothetical protein
MQKVAFFAEIAVTVSVDNLDFNYFKMGLSEILEKMLVWEKGSINPFIDYTGNDYRVDKFGKVMKHSEYGNRDSAFGWEIGHIKSRWVGGTDDLGNLTPLNWKSNMEQEAAESILRELGSRH